jgi:hypothetical protein
MKKWKVGSNSARKNQVCSPIKPLAAEKIIISQACVISVAWEKKRLSVITLTYM